MNYNEASLLVTAIVILVGLLVYALLVTRRGAGSKSATSQAESLKSMLDEYAQKVKSDVDPLDRRFDISTTVIPTKQYAPYSNSRAVEEMGLTQEEADLFEKDLVTAIEAEIPKIEKAILASDYKTIEEIVHTITGSSSTLGSGGVSSALISFYAAVQHRDSFKTLYIHLQNLKYYISELKEVHAKEA